MLLFLWFYLIWLTLLTLKLIFLVFQTFLVPKNFLIFFRLVIILILNVILVFVNFNQLNWIVLVETIILRIGISIINWLWYISNRFNKSSLILILFLFFKETYNLLYKWIIIFFILLLIRNAIILINQWILLLAVFQRNQAKLIRSPWAWFLIFIISSNVSGFLRFICFILLINYDSITCYKHNYQYKHCKYSDKVLLKSF